MTPKEKLVFAVRDFAFGAVLHAVTKHLDKPPMPEEEEALLAAIRTFVESAFVESKKEN